MSLVQKVFQANSPSSRGESTVEMHSSLGDGGGGPLQTLFRKRRPQGRAQGRFFETARTAHRFGTGPEALAWIVCGSARGSLDLAPPPAELMPDANAQAERTGHILSEDSKFPDRLRHAPYAAGAGRKQCHIS